MRRRSRHLFVPTLILVAILSVLITLAVRAMPAAAPDVNSTQGATITAAAALSDATTAAAATASPSVVLIRSSGSLGSGVIVDKGGYIVTNYHVLGREGNAPAPTSYLVTLSNGTSYNATVAGTDSPDDLALLKISAPNLRVMQVADSNKVRVGEFVLAVGNPLGYAQTVTFGIISTLRRTMSEGGSPALYIPDMIQASAPINPGNSGGALVDLQGRLVGIPTLAAADPSQGTAAQGIGFAIPSNRVAFIAKQIIANGRVVNSGRPFLGIGNIGQATPQLAAQYGLGADNGVAIGVVVPDGPAAKAGVKAGDVIVALNGQPTLSVEAFNEALARLKPGQRIPVTVVTTNGQRHSVTITLGELPVQQ
ncbi:MAG: S1C family serine protease [Chloroflexota bacterium]